jgi:hypothetical protein
MPVESQRSALRAAWEKLRGCYLQRKAKPYEAHITKALRLTEDYNMRRRLRTPSNVIRENEALREPLEIKNNRPCELKSETLFRPSAMKIRTRDRRRVYLCAVAPCRCQPIAI